MISIDHCIRLSQEGLLENLFRVQDGRWQDFFAQDASVAGSSGAFGDVVLVRGKATRMPYALKLFKKPLTDDELERLLIILEFSRHFDTKGLSATWPASLVRYIDGFRFIDRNRNSENPQQDAILLQRIDGDSLKNITFQSKIRVGTDQWRCWMKDVFEALAFLHENGIMHRDGHSGNIMISSDGKRAFLIDLDLMCLPSSPSCSALCRVGKAAPISTAPDVWCQNSITVAPASQLYASDVWATGSAFLGYLLAEKNVLLTSIGFSRDRGAMCKVKDERSINETIAKTLKRLDPSSRDLFARLLNADWRQRPTAREAYEMLGDCSDRKRFVSPLDSKSLGFEKPQNVDAEGYYVSSDDEKQAGYYEDDVDALLNKKK